MLCQFNKKLCRVLLAISAALLVTGSPPAYAVHDNDPAPQLFELDANTIDPGTALPDDWESFYTGGTNHARASTGIVEDTDAKVFFGGSKDTKDLDDWKWKGGSSPPKADLTHAYSAAYNQGSDIIVYFGANRDSNSGTTTTGFWFFKNPVCAKANGTFGNGDSNSTGNCLDPNAPAAKHAIDDTLIVANYDNGGKVGKIVVYRWDGSALVKKVESDNQLGTGGQIFCVDKTGTNTTTGDDICAITNKDTTNIPWASPVPPGAFLEGGVNVSKLIESKPCFASFMATSRSSTTEVAEIKNFILHSFPVCGITVGKTCVKASDGSAPKLNPDGVTVHVRHTASITAEGDIFDVTVKELIGDATTGKLPAGEQCKLTAISSLAVNPPALPIVLISDTVAAFDQKVSDSLIDGGKLDLTIECDTHQNPMTNKVQFTAGSSDNGTDLTANYTETAAKGELADCALTVEPGLSAKKVCTSVTLTNGVDPFVCVDITVTSTTTEDMDKVYVDDNKVGSVFSNITLQPGESKTVNKCYTATASDGNETDPEKITYTDQLTKVVGHGVFSNIDFDLSKSGPLPSISCPLCPPPQHKAP